MNKRIKRLWIKALRSRKFRQGNGQLRRGRIAPTYCCLGVLCEIAKEEGAIKSYIGTNAFLPPKVIAWAELNADNPILSWKDDKYRAAYLNDAGKTFAEIANRIEKYL